MKWSIRNIDQDVVDMVAEVAGISGATYGGLVSEAVRSWYAALPVAGDIAQAETAAALGQFGRGT